MARDFLGNIRGPQGPKGDTGSQGPKGDDGDRGPQGPQGESETPYIVDSGEQVDDTGAHFYEIYNTGKGRAWGYHIIRGVEFDTPLGPFHRYRGTYKINGLIDFDIDTVKAQIFVDNRTDTVNCLAMTTIDNGGWDNVRLMVFNPDPQMDVTVYLSYDHQGTPL